MLKRVWLLALFSFSILPIGVKANSLALFDVQGAGIVGQWRYIGHYYRDQFQLPYNPDLVLLFHFSEDSQSRLTWYRLGEMGFCDRKGQYKWDGSTLFEKVLWVNYKNAPDCGKDPDMRLGSESRSKLKRLKNQLFLSLPLGEEELIYIFEPDFSELPPRIIDGEK